MPTIEVCSQVFGGLQDSPLLPSVFLNLIQEHLTVAQLIQHTVEQQVRELLVRREMDTQQVRRTLERHYLTAAEVAVQAQQGAVCYPSDRTIKTPEVDLKDEIQKALRAFEAGSYIILVNGQQVGYLEEEVSLSMNTKVTFLRLMPLVGG